MRAHLPFIILFFTLIIIGLTTYKDYGISWDESVQRKDNGHVNYNYIHYDDYESLINGNEKYHGPAFEMLLVVFEKKLGLINPHDIFLMRHLVTFLLFAVSVLFFYLLCIKLLKNQWLALIGCAILILSPRIFADSFYNSKDLSFMSMVIINIYASIIYFERKNIITAIFHAIVSAIAIDIRIMGIIMPFFTYLIMLIDFIRHSDSRRKILISGFVFTVFLIGAVILIWPVLWIGPVKHFILALKEMSKYPWESNVFYRGEIIKATNLPWHYIPVWILISTPLLYSILFIYGMVIILKNIFKLSFSGKGLYLNLYIMFLPVLLVIILHSVVYDGWRHLYFIYPSFVIIALTGLDDFIFRVKLKKGVKNILSGGLILYFCYIAIIMINLHPFEYVYFNKLAGNSLAEAREKYEMDYWGLSYKQGLEYILKTDTNSHIVINFAESVPGTDNMLFLPNNDCKRISRTNAGELADYYITSYRYYHEINKIPADYSIIRNNGIILSVFNLNKNKIILTNKNLISSFITTYDNPDDHFSPGKIYVDSTSTSGNKCQLVDSSIIYPGGFSWHPTTDVLKSSQQRKYIYASFNIRSLKPFETSLVLEIDSGKSYIYSWDSYRFRGEKSNEWIKYNFVFRFPQTYSTEDIVKIFIWNTNQNNFEIDDFKIDIYAVDENEVNKTFAKMPI